jgi:hypothetical protein
MSAAPPCSDPAHSDPHARLSAGDSWLEDPDADLLAAALELGVYEDEEEMVEAIFTSVRPSREPEHVDAVEGAVISTNRLRAVLTSREGRGSPPLALGYSSSRREAPHLARRLSS